MNRAIKIQASLISFIVLLAACTKIDYTRIGADLIPVVDNINTFDTILEVQSFNYIPPDSSRMFVSDPHPAGAIENDPLFGSSRSSLFFEVKPTTFPFAGFGPQDSIAGFDSAVLVLSYRGAYGDSASPVNFKLYEVDQKMQYDTLTRPNYTFNPALGANTAKLWGQKTMEPRRFRDTIPIKRGDSVYAKVTNQLRIRLDQRYAAGLFYQAYDTAKGTFKSDSLYKEYLPGFALVPEGAANALMYFALQDASTKLEFYYRVKIVGRTDTTSQGFTINSRCAHAIKFERNR
ncbi:MAG: DUF4270 domain-containing protein, partial [Chitinophagaceae bacterium]|nr:DUF4270 domain-containing protein [Chitinophagaceae bacterium]